MKTVNIEWGEYHDELATFRFHDGTALFVSNEVNGERKHSSTEIYIDSWAIGFQDLYCRRFVLRFSKYSSHTQSELLADC